MPLSMIRPGCPGTLLALGLALSLSLSGCSSGGDGDSDSGGGGGVSLSGTISSAAGADVDGDTNDPFSPLMPNNTPGAQVLSNPIVVGGYVTPTGTGQFNVPGQPDDRFAFDADLLDEYRVNLVTGQTINLYMADHRNGAVDLDIAIFDPANPTGPPLQSSLGTGPIENITVTVPDGAYDLTVAAAGARGANYVLTVGQEAASAAAGVLSLEHEFVPGEVLVRLHPQRLNAMAQPLAQGGFEALGMTPVWGEAGETQLLKLGDAATRQATMSALGADPAALLDRDRYAAMNAPAQLRVDTLAVVKALRARADVATADPNYIRRAMLTPDDTHYPKQWHYPQINLPQAWDITTGSANVIVAVVDTGVFLAHPDLDALLVPGYDFISSAANARDGDGIDNNPDDPGDNATPGLSSFHGTHVAGTVAAESNDGSGIAGTSWLTRIMPLRVLGRNGGSSADIIQAIRFAARLSNTSGTLPATRADIINLSLGGGGSSATEQAEYANVRNAGVIVIAAAGNDNTSALSFPASYDGVVSVSAVDFTKNRAPYSNFGTAIDVAAPGGNTGADASGDGLPDGVLSTVVDDSSGSRQAAYTFYNGTSMAAPHMAGVVALMKAINPDLTPDELDNFLASGAITEDLGSPGRDNDFGHGLIDALRAVQSADGSFLALTLAPSSANFGSALNTLEVVAGQIGTGAISVTGVTVSAGAPWLSVSPLLGGDGQGTYTLTVNRTGLADGVYNASVTFATNDTMANGSVAVPVTMRVGADPAPGNTGFTFVILVDAQSGDTVQTVAVANSNGRYAYRFDDVAPGSYQVIAGTDSDNDVFLCDEGEACGGYPTVSLFEPIAVGNSNIAGLDFTVTFSVGLNAAAESGPARPAFRRGQLAGGIDKRGAAP